MSAPELPDEGREPVEKLLASELAQAIDTDDYKGFLDRLPIAVAVSRPKGGEARVTYWNPVFEKMIGAPAKGAGWSILDRFVRDDGTPLGKAVAEADDFVGLFRSPGESESDALLVQAYVGRIETEEGLEKYRFVALVDLTCASPEQEELERQIRDKDLLLREVQHRVKNNLQLIVGLIRLEARSVSRGDKVDLDRLARRIEALQLLYQTMTVEGWGEEIDLGHYLSQIASAVVHAHGNDQIALDTSVNYSPVPINIAMPIGLAVNELLTNAFKHAFPGRTEGAITLECLREEESYRIVVADNGGGFAPGTTWPVPGKLSALVVQTLRENAKVDVSVLSSGLGTKVVLTFSFEARGGKAN
jgi:two-component sensor histidine kinase